MRYLILLLISINYLGQSTAQTTNSYIRNPGYYTLGLNLGVAYQSSDVTADVFQGGGWGLTLAKNLYYAPGSAISFDLRGRFLTTRQVGLDGVRSFDIANNPALNGERGANYLDYPQEFGVDPGFAFYNHRTRTYELALEGVFELNQLREQSHFIISFYGGIGLDWYRTRTNVLDDLGNPYYAGFSSLANEDRRGRARSDLRNDILDDDYETAAAGFEGNEGQVDFMPSLGLDLGYEFSPGASIHLGHRLTFSGTDILDGNNFVDDRQDIYHYTHGALRFIIDPARRRSIARRPIIDVTAPVVSPYTGNTRRYTVRANIQNVSSSMDVEANYNGRNVPFDFVNGRFTKEVVLDNGQNILVIEAQNEVGSDRKEVVLYYSEEEVPSPVGDPPTVTILSPARNPYSTTNPRLELRASVREVNSKSDIEVRVNGRNIAFDLLRDRTTILANLSLENGVNRVRVEARNRWGQDQAQAEIRLERASNPSPGPVVVEPDRPPRVRITEPRDFANVDQPRVELQAELKNVTNRRQVRVAINGVAYNGFNFSRGRLRAEIPLEVGNNRILVRAQNPDGSDEDGVNVRYRPSPPPQVNITSPNDGSTSSQANIRLEASTQHVGLKNQLELRINGTRASSFNFNSGRLTADLRLQEGSNRISLSAQTNSGSDQDVININYNPIKKPTVRITSPSSDPFRTSESNIEIKARLEHVTLRDNISPMVRGTIIRDFDYSNGELRFRADLNQGDNKVEIQVRTNGGRAADKTMVIYTPKSGPAVRFIKPARTGTRTTSNRQSFIIQVDHVTKQEELSVFFNNRPVTSFQFNTSTGKLSLASSLKDGENKLRVVAQTAYGRDEAELVIFYDRREVATRKPTVEITSISRPVTDPTNPNSIPSSTILAKFTNVANASEITLLINGESISNFDFNRRTGAFSATVRMKKGTNTVVLRATTSAGTAEASEEVGI